VWCATLKGWARTQDGKRIDPLTLSGACSLYVLCCQAVDKTETVRLRVQSTEARAALGAALSCLLIFCLSSSISRRRDAVWCGAPGSAHRVPVDRSPN